MESPLNIKSPSNYSLGFNLYYIHNLSINSIVYCIILVYSVIHLQLMIIQTPHSSRIYSDSITQIEENSANLHSVELNNYQSSLYQILRWTQISIHIENYKNIIFCIGVPIWAICIVTIVMATKSKKINHRNRNELQGSFSYKIIICSVFIISYCALPTVSRICFSLLIGQNYPWYLSLIAGITISVFIMLYCLYIVSMRDKSWMSSNANGSIQYPNPITLYNIYRMIIAVIVYPINMHSENFNGQAPFNENFPVGTFIIAFLYCIVMIFVLYRRPIISSIRNKLQRSILISSIIISLIRVLEICFNTKFSPIMIVLNILFGIFAGNYLCDKRIIRIMLKSDQNKTQICYKIKLLCFYVHKLKPAQQRQNRQFLEAYLGHHRRYCTMIQCPCNQIIDIRYKKEYNNQQQNKQQTKHNQTSRLFLNRIRNINEDSWKNQQRNQLQIQKELWFKLIYCRIQEIYQLQEFCMATKTQKSQNIDIFIDLIYEKVYILLQYFGKIYQSMQILQTIQVQMQKLEIHSLDFEISKFMLEVMIQQKLIRIVKKKDEILCSKKFVEFQFEFDHFRKLMYEAIYKSRQFWVQIATNDPRRINTVKLLENINKLSQKSGAYYEKLCQQYNSSKLQQMEGKTYEQRWDKKVKLVLDEIYMPFKIFSENLIEDQSQILKVLLTFKVHKNKIIRSNILQKCDSDSKIPTCIVNIGYGQNFTRIQQGNRQFWQLAGNTKKPKEQISDFLPTQFIEEHHRRMKNFLIQDNYELPPLETFILTVDKIIEQVRFFGIVYPNLQNGFKYAAFLERKKSYPNTIMMNSNGIVLGYTDQLQQLAKNIKIAPEQLIQSKFIQIFLSMYQNQSTINIIINNLEFQMKCFHKITNKDPKKVILFIQLKNQSHDYVSNIQAQSIQQAHSPNILVEQHKAKSISNQSIASEPSNKDKFKIQQLIKIISRQKRISSIEIWFRVSLVLIFFIVCLSSIVTYPINTKKQDYLRNFYEYQNFSQFYISLLHVAYGIRRTNIISYENKLGVHFQTPLYNPQNPIQNQKTVFRVYQEGIQYDIAKIDEVKQYVNFDWGQMVEAFDFSNEQISQKTQVTFDILKNKFILAAATQTRKQSMQDLAFNYLLKQVNKPYTSQTQNFYNAFYNLQFVLIPKLRQWSDNYYQQLFKDEIQNFLGIQMIILFIMILLSTIICFYTLYIRYQIKYLIDLSLRLISKPSFKCIQRRVKQYKNYENYFSSQIVARKELQQQSAQPKNNNANTRRISRHLSMARRDSQNTKNHLQIVDTLKKQDNVQKQSKTSKQNPNNIQIKPQNISIQYLCIILVSVMLIALISSAFLLQNLSNQTVMYFNKDIVMPMQQRIQNFILVRNTMLEGPFQYLNFSFPYPSIAQQKQAALDYAYSTNTRFLNNIDQKIIPKTFNRINDLKFQEFCNIPLKTPLNKRPENVQDQCNQYMMIYFNTKAIDQLYLLTIETARRFSNIDISNQDPEYRRSFYYYTFNFRYEQWGSFHERIAIYYRETLEQDLIDMTNKYTNQMYYNIGGILVYCVVMIIWTIKLHEYLQKQKGIIQTIFKLISFNYIKDNKNMIDQLEKHAKYFWFLK